MEKDKIFSTRDIYLATALVTLGFEITSIDYQQEGERPQPVGYFNFTETEGLVEQKNKFWAGKLSVEPRSFVGNLRGLKAEVTNAYKGPRSRFSHQKSQKETVDNPVDK